MDSDFNASLARVLVYEGGKVDNPKDPGGRTDKGVTQATFNAWLLTHGQPIRDVYTIIDVEVAKIYHDEFWAHGHCDELPSGVDFVVFDGAVNSGVGMSLKWLQQSIGNIKVDGVFGAGTKSALAGVNDVEALIEGYCSRRLSTLMRNPNWKTFGPGWGARISNGQKIAIAWEQGSGPNNSVDPVDVTSAGGHMKAPVADIKPSKISLMQTHVVTGAGALSTTAANLGQSLAPASDTFAWLKYVLGGLTIVGAGTGAVLFLDQRAKTNAKEGSGLAVVDPDADADFPRAQMPPLVALASSTGVAAPAPATPPAKA